MEAKSGVLKAVVIIVAFCRSIIVVEIVEFSSFLSPPVNGKNFRKKASPSSGPRSLRLASVKPITKSIPMKRRAAIERTIS